MRKAPTSLLLLLQLALALVAIRVPALAHELFFLPSDPRDVIRVYSDTLAPLATVSSGAAAFFVAGHPAGSKYWVVSRSATDSILVLDSTFTVTKRINIASPPAAALLAANGARLYVSADTLRIIDTVTESETGTIASAAGATHLALSPEGRYLYALMAGTSRLVKIDLNNNATLESVASPALASGLSVAPDGGVWVSAEGLLVEYSGVNLARLGAVTLKGKPGKFSFTPSGRYGIAPNLEMGDGDSVYLINTATRALTTKVITVVFRGVIPIERIEVVSETRALGYSKTLGYLYDISLPSLNYAETSIGGNTQEGVADIASSGELPNTIAGYVMARGTIRRVALSGNSFTTSATGGDGTLRFIQRPATGGGAQAVAFNTTQRLETGVPLKPVYIRVVDGSGTPVNDLPVTLSTTAGLTVTPTTARTSSNGFLMVTISAASGGNYTLRAALGSGRTEQIAITLQSPTSSAPETARVVKVQGDGQIVLLASPAPQPMVLDVLDARGLAMPNVNVTWTNASGGLTVRDRNTVTDANGRTSNTYVGSTSLTTANFFLSGAIQAQVEGVGTVTFRGTTVPLDPTLQASVRLVQPLEMTTPITLRAGEKHPGAIRVNASSSTGAAIPFVALTATTDNDPAVGPTASCDPDNALSSVCDLIAGPVLGTARLRVEAGGGYRSFEFTVNVIPGEADVPRILSGDAQTGLVGDLLPVALSAQITDKAGNPLANLPVFWEVRPAGAVTLTDASTVTDSNGRVSARARLTDLAGAHEVRLTVGPVSTVFRLTAVVPSRSFSVVSGSGQTVTDLTQLFPAPLVVRATDDLGRGIPNLAVNWTVTQGQATLSTSANATSSTGEASITVRAAGAPGSIIITATAAGFPAVSFNLTVQTASPPIQISSIADYGTGELNVAVLGGLLEIRTSGILTGAARRTYHSSLLGGRLLIRLENVSVHFGPTAIAAPIYSLSPIAGSASGESIVVQVPWELSGTAVDIQVRAAGGVGNATAVPLRQASPGVMEESDGAGGRRAVAFRSDGLIVTTATPARRGERIRVYVTGLGQTTPLNRTNRIGLLGQKVNARVIVGLDDAPVTVIDAYPAPNLVGIYEIVFDVPASTPGGNRAFGFTVELGPGNVLYSNASVLAVAP